MIKLKSISEEWKYYNDGKTWLFRTLKKKKTLFWIRILKNTFRIAFWFINKLEPIILESDSHEKINRYKIGKIINLIYLLTVTKHNNLSLIT